MPKIIPTRTRAILGQGGMTLEFTGSADRKWNVVLSVETGRQLLETLTNTFAGPIPQMAADQRRNKLEPGALQSAIGNALQVRANDDGSLALTFVAPQGMLEIVVDIAEAERIHAAFVSAITSAKIGRHPTRQ